MCDQVPIVSCLSLVWSPALPGFLVASPFPDKPPPCRSASAGTTRGQGTVGFMSPIFRTGDVAQAGGPRHPDQVLPALQGGNSQKVLSLKYKELWSQTASRSNPPLPLPGWTHPKIL